MSWNYRSIQNIDIRSHIENYVANTMHTLQLRMSTISNQLFESKKFFEKTLGKQSEHGLSRQFELSFLFHQIGQPNKKLGNAEPIGRIGERRKFH